MGLRPWLRSSHTQSDNPNRLVGLRGGDASKTQRRDSPTFTTSSFMCFGSLFTRSISLVCRSLMMILSSSSVCSSAMALDGGGAVNGGSAGRGPGGEQGGEAPLPPAACSSCPASLALLQAKINVLPPAAALKCPLKGLCWGQPLQCHLWGGHMCGWLVTLKPGRGWHRAVGVQPPTGRTCRWEFSPHMGEMMPKLGQKFSKA